MADEYTFEFEDLGSLGEYLGALEAGAEAALLEADEDVLLDILGQLDRLAYGDLDQFTDEGRERVEKSLASIAVASGSWTHTDAFAALQVRGRISDEDHATVERLRAMIRTELEERWGDSPPGAN